MVELCDGIDIRWVGILCDEVDRKRRRKRLSLGVDGIRTKGTIWGQRAKMLVVYFLQTHQPGDGFHMGTHVPPLEIRFKGQQGMQVGMQELFVLGGGHLVGVETGERWGGGGSGCISGTGSGAIASFVMESMQLLHMSQ